MLLLTRKPEQTICIYPGDEINDKDKLIEIHIVHVRGAQVQIGIDAPLGITVHRKEVYKRILSQQNKQGE
jgi:carbon storage regulator